MALLEIENLSVDFPSRDNVMHAVEGVSGAPDDSVAVHGGCNECLINVGVCACTTRQCLRASPSEQFVCDVVGASTANMNRMRNFDGSTLILWRVTYNKNEDQATKARLPFKLAVSWIRFTKTSD